MDTFQSVTDSYLIEEEAMDIYIYSTTYIKQYYTVIDVSWTNAHSHEEINWIASKHETEAAEFAV